MENTTIMEARKMSMKRLQIELGKCAKHLENEYGMTHIDACIFVSKIMNFGIAMHEKSVKSAIK